MNTSPKEVHGTWRRGWTLDAHTLSSEFLGYDPNGHAQFETKRSPLGELVYLLKYRGQKDRAAEVAAVMATFVREQVGLLERIDGVIAMPPSTIRQHQPVLQIAIELARQIEKAHWSDSVRKIRDTPELKSVHDPEQRRDLLDGAFDADPSKVKGRGVLLIDDLFRSGATANAVTIALMNAGASRVYLLAATRTRSNQ